MAKVCSQSALRFLIATMAGLATGSIALFVAWQSLGGGPSLAFRQSWTQSFLEEIADAIDVYRQRENTLPASLDNLRSVDDLGLLPFREEGMLDGWERPFVYTTNGNDFTVMSYGRDGKPGGVGLDCDLTHAAPRPPSSFMTFTQFLFERPTGRIVGTCVASPLLAFILCWRLAEPAQTTKQSVFDLCKRVVAVIIGAVIVGLILAVFHLPTGH